VETECGGRVRLLSAARGELQSFDAGVTEFDSWLCGAESQLRIMQRSVGDLHKFRQHTTTDLQVVYFASAGVAVRAAVMPSLL